MTLRSRTGRRWRFTGNQAGQTLRRICPTLPGRSIIWRSCNTKRTLLKDTLNSYREVLEVYRGSSPLAPTGLLSRRCRDAQPAGPFAMPEGRICGRHEVVPRRRWRFTGSWSSRTHRATYPIFKRCSTIWVICSTKRTKLDDALKSYREALGGLEEN